jgi:chromosome partitioning protein
MAKKQPTTKTANYTAKKVSVINMKGGVGKTTLSIHLAYYLAKHKNQRVLLIDLDPQANASVMGIKKADLDKHYKDHDKKTTFDLFVNWLKPYGPFPKPEPAELKLDEYTYRAVTANGEGFLDIIPSHIYLSSILRGVSIEPYELDNFLKKETAAEQKYQYILIDCAPTYSVLTTLALNATKQVLIPMTADPFGIHGTELMQYVLDEHQHDYGVRVKVIGVVFTLLEKQAHALDYYDIIRKKWKPEQSFKANISKNNNYKILSGKNLETGGDIDLMSSRLHEKAKQEFRDFVEEFLQKMGA